MGCKKCKKIYGGFVNSPRTAILSVLFFFFSGKGKPIRMAGHSNDFLYQTVHEECKIHTFIYFKFFSASHG